MKRLFAILLAILLVLTFAGCAEVKEQDSILVPAILVDTHYKGMWLQPVVTGKSVTMITHPADYDLIFEYEGKRYNLDVDSETYNTYENAVGQEFDMELVTTVYDDDTTETVLRFPEEAQ